MPRIVIVGGGFAGVWSAAGAARVRSAAHLAEADMSITVIAPNDRLVLRPRLYEPEPHRATVALRRVFEPIGVEHRRARVLEIDVENHRVALDSGTTVDYDRLVLAAGSQLVRPAFPGAEQLFDVDTLDGANRLAGRLRGLKSFTAVVVGAGFTGLEIATELAGRGRVVLVERSEVVGPELGPGPRPAIEEALEEVGVQRRLGTTVTAIEDGKVVLPDGTRIAADAVVWTAGLRANPLTAQIPGPRDGLGRLSVGPDLNAGNDIFVAGDTAAAPADDAHTTLQSCQHATPLGKTAGHNAAADLLGMPPIDFTPAPYVTDIDLGAAGAILTRGWDRQVESTGTDGKRLKKWIMNRIHPPVDNATEILTAASRIYNPVPTAAEIPPHAA
ncbi:NAD(P)/FAD-dependent oxidoreductase [Nocardia transvalensis]|uniref:NAD(P)/FAD-dependent oxidoreductase n=1 Tax=Nocardia transvalensis TaxID=37333 RepID=UPI001894B444|nr:FAD-dependent oxidoreductase [Nocardia transvalensis]MBF6332727.1 FAD-dependent oxidoreductase [Nocardia transvalensis]